ncbi:MAG: tyrosine-type recombinase/integrase [Acidimicrobiia bacterium]|nr:tyrosine-type recombinase/integrase [Acidimicrobiia bacterium]MYB74415.1 tyrosine-type recombinase/integrase [Acidimicrobiia bacterium]MYI00183.1 tyrosine-type recombinase/integrase [Acidimicrobiia bacterium]
MTGRLTDELVATAPAGTYGDGRGGNGLRLVVQPSGSRSWVQRLRTEGGQLVNRGLGSAAEVTLTQARERAAVNAGKAPDPAPTAPPPVADDTDEVLRLQLQLAEAENEKLRLQLQLAQQPAAPPQPVAIPTPPASGGPLLSEVLEQVIAHKRPGWRAGSTSERTWRTQMGYLDGLMATPVGGIAAGDVQRALAGCSPNIARLNRQRLSACFKWAMLQGWCHADPAAAVAGFLPKQPDTEHHDALPHTEVAAAVAKVRASDNWEGSRLAIEFLVLTAARSGEVRGMTWGEVDLAERVWTVPADRMKAGRSHRVALSDQAVAVLEQARDLADGSGLVFPSYRGKQLAPAALVKITRPLLGTTCHGFRSAFSVWGHESGYPSELIEAALAHADYNKARAAYARTDLLDQRRPVMQAWADHIDS